MMTTLWPLLASATRLASSRTRSVKCSAVATCPYRKGLSILLALCHQHNASSESNAGRGPVLSMKGTAWLGWLAFPVHVQARQFSGIEAQLNALANHRLIDG